MAKESIFQNETQLNQKEQEAGQQITELEIKNKNYKHNLILLKIT